MFLDTIPQLWVKVKQKISSLFNSNNVTVWLYFPYHFINHSIYRGHTVKAVCESFQMAKDAGFKVVAHMMPDLPNVGWERDIEQFIVCNIFSWSQNIKEHFSNKFGYLNFDSRLNSPNNI